MKTITDKVNKLKTLSESVKVNHKKNLWDQLIEISKLTRDNPTCNIWDYYRLGIYRRDLSSRQTRREYLGYGANEEFNLTLNSRSGVSAAWDKLLFELIACTYGIPTPHTVAVFKEQ